MMQACRWGEGGREGGGYMCTPFQIEIYKQQYAKWYLQYSHQLKLRSLATH